MFQHFKTKQIKETNEKPAPDSDTGDDRSTREVIAPAEPKIQPVVVSFGEGV